MTPTDSQEKQRTCSHTRESGLKCRAVAMTGTKFCFFHGRAFQRRRILKTVLSASIAAFSKPGAKPQNTHWDAHTAILFGALDLPLVEDASSIQVLLNTLIQSVATHQLTERRASFILRAVRTFVALKTPFGVERSEVRDHPELAADRDSDPLYYPFAGCQTTQNLVAADEPNENGNEDSEGNIVRPDNSGPSLGRAT